MLQENDFLEFVKAAFVDDVLKQSPSNLTYPPEFISLSLNLDFTKLIKTRTQLATSIVSNFPSFMKTIQQGCEQILKQRQILRPLNGFKIGLDIKNCILPKHNIKSIDFLNAALSQKEGILLYLKNAEILQVSQPELYLQSWSQVWQPQCSCQTSKEIEVRVKQSLIDILKKSQRNLKSKILNKQTLTCSSCFGKLKLKQAKKEDFTFINCRRLTFNVNPSNQTFKSQIFSDGLIEVYVEGKTIHKFKVGDIIDMCCYYKMNVEYIKTFSKMQTQIIHNFYLVTSYPQEDYITSTDSLFLGKLISLQLKQISIFRVNDIENIMCNYKNFNELINRMKFPYLEQNTLTAFKMVTINSIFCHQILKQRLNILILTDQLNVIERSIRINNLNIQKLPTIYDDKTIMTFLHSCHNSILLVVNPNKKDFTLINKLLKRQIMETLHLTIWVIVEPEENLKKKMDIEYFDIILDLTLEKNLNVCQNVYQNLVDKLLNSFISEQQLDFNNILTIPKKKRNIFDHQDSEFIQLQQDDAIRQEKIAKDLLERYFLKSRQYKTVKFNNIQIIRKISQSFMNFRYFIKNKGKIKKVRKHLSVLDAILTIFIDEETNRNKYSKSNTLFADDISKVMLNESNGRVSVWEYEYQDNYIQENKKFIGRDQMVSRVIIKVFSLLYQEQLI